ncbi:MAG: Rho termination factor N-terminal domain-containing protein, partial [Marmoricola sp.]
MTETTDTTAAPEATSAGKRASGGLSGMLLPELKQVAGGLGIKAAGMKKADLVAAIKAAQGGGQNGNRGSQQGDDRPRRQAPEDQAPKGESAKGESAKDESSKSQAPKDEAPRSEARQERVARNEGARNEAAKDQGAKDQGAKDQGDRAGNGRNQNNQQNNQQNNANQNNQNAAGDEEGGSRRNRRRRGRDRDRPAAQAGQPQQQGNQPQQSRGNRNEPDLQILEDDVLAPCAGILDVLDSYAFVRTSGYLPGTDDVYVSLSTVRKYGLRRGDALVGQVRQPREGDRKEKFNPLVKLDSVNGGDPEAARSRVEFSKLTPLYPSERLRMETTPGNMIGRVIDIASPIGKGQRGLIVSPAKAGKTMIMQSIANSITTNNPECHLMVVLVDERPEEVTDFERSVNGEVIS